MFHNRAYRKLGRKHQHRVATLRALTTALFERERIRTTLMKAKELRPFAEKLITKGKRDDLHARRLVMRHVQDRRVVKKLFESLAPRYSQRNGGYMRILRLGTRPGDGAEMALVELIGSEPVFKKATDKKADKKAGRGAKKAAGQAAAGEAPGKEAKEAKEPEEGTTDAPKPSRRGKKSS